MHMTALKSIKRIVIGVVGGTVLALGIALIVLPGPAFLVIPAGLAILAIEFAWARRWLRSARAILPRASAGTGPRRRITTGTVWRSMGFLLRQVRRTLLPKRRVT
jgi:uncharacterized protein (TIGR02611 family)